MAKNSRETALVEVETNLITAWHRDLDARASRFEISGDTVAAYTYGLERYVVFATYNHVGRTDQQIADAVNDWKAELLTAYSPGSVNVWLAGVKDFYAWLCARKMRTTDPVSGIKAATRKSANSRHKRDPIAGDEMRRILALELSPRDRCIAHLKAYTGMRDVEIHRADLVHLRDDGGRMVLQVIGKGRREADELVVIAHPDARAAVHDYLAWRGSKPGPLFVSSKEHMTRLSRRMIRYIVKQRMLVAAGVVGAAKTSHSFRHAAATNILANGGTIRDVQSVLRHANIATSGIYAHEMNRVAAPGERFIDYSA